MAAVDKVSAVLPVHEAVGSRDVLELVKLFADTWFSLDVYAKEAFTPKKVTKKKVTLTSDERALNRAIDSGAYVSAYSAAEKRRFQAAAKQTFTKQRAVNVRISERNLARLKAVAARGGMSYQTFITALIQKHV